MELLDNQAYLIKTFINLGYSESLQMKIIKILIEKKLNDDDKKLKLYCPEQKTVSVKLPCIGKFLPRIKKELNKVVHQLKL